VGLFAGIAAVLGLMGGVVQINPVWLYGPFRPEAVSSPAQPDWYLGWLEGALRIFPNWEIRVWGHSVPNPFFPAVVLPGVTFTLLYAWPFLERRFTGDHLEHHLLDRPREHPVRTAIGATAFTFYTLLLIAGSNDIVAKLFLVSVSGVTWVMRILVVALPIVVGALFYLWLRALRRSGAESVLHVPLRAFRAALSRAPDISPRATAAPEGPSTRAWAMVDQPPSEAPDRLAGTLPRAADGGESGRGWAVGETSGVPVDAGEERRAT
jgi:ubiquinol-cytochrome c reductase cytochrome b subunit